MEHEIVIVMGPPGGGKTTHVQSLVKQGYTRINRDEIGGKLNSPDSKIYKVMQEQYKRGKRRFVLDNTYRNVAARRGLMVNARQLNLPVRVLWLQTTREQAQLFAARRQIQKFGVLFGKKEYKKHRKNPNMFPPMAQFAYWKQFEDPTMAEGFDSIEEVDVVTDFGSEYTGKALLLDYDGTLRLTNSGDHYPKEIGDVRALEGRTAIIQEYIDKGYRILGISNQSGVSQASDSPKYVSDVTCRDCFDETNRQLGHDIEYLFAPDRGGPPSSYWRKPMAGMGVVFIEKYKLNPDACIYVGDMKSDQTFAARAGFQFEWAKDFFGD